ncbi:MAG: hypothetical protein M3545_12600 [Acidobacteriota bacterium]|nr:hypothetical protein [Acidobacteriota bacterium]
MQSRVIAALLVAGCVTAAAGGAYVAVRQNAGSTHPPVAQPATALSPAPVQETEAVAETEAVIDNPPAPPVDHPPARPRVGGEPERGAPASITHSEETKAARRPQREAAETAVASGPKPTAASERTSVRPAERPPAVRTDQAAVGSRPSGSNAQQSERPAAERVADPALGGPPVVETPAEPVRTAEVREPVRERQFEEVVLPASSVLGLKVETPLSSERTQPEDRVDARLTRDVSAGGRVAVPAGSRVVGSVTMVERGGKMKERARLGVRFHTLVLEDGREVPLRTEAIIREGDSPSNESARKIGGAAIGGAILGAIMGGGKGAVIGSAAGAAGGSAAVMAGDRNAATLPAGTIVSVRLAEPATIELEKAQ